MTLCYRGALAAAPYANQPVACFKHPGALETETDFAATALMARSSWAPVLVSFAQRHDLMDRLMASLEDCLGGRVERVLLQARVPAGGRMPSSLSRQDVFVVCDLEPEIERLRDAGFSFLAIHEGLVRHPLETGANELEVDWFNPPPDGADAFARFVEAIVRLGFVA